MMSEDPIVIVAAKRTPLGHFMGELSTVPAPRLGETAIRAALAQSTLSGQDIDEVLMGCVLPAGLGQAPARQAALYAELPQTTGATTINKMCGSGMKALLFAHDMLAAGNVNCMLAGGMENMSLAPYLLPKARAGYRLGHGQLLDHMMLDGLEDVYDAGRPMGYFAEQTATQYQFSRQMQDEFALQSLERAKQAAAQHLFDDEIAAVSFTKRRQDITIDSDEGPRIVNADKIPSLRPAFVKDGTVTAANSSSISDGAAALILMRESTAAERGVKPLARLVAHASHAKAPAEFTTAPIGAISQCLEKSNWSQDQVDLFEINEAFAVVTMAAMHDLKLPADKVNIFGGACVLGHPIGATGARIVVTLLNALKQQDKQFGVAALCIGGGEATAVAIERC
jgi:acetyl-CoA C-acetyltransferase